MSESLSVFSYSAGYIDAANGDVAQRPDCEPYMEGFREGLKVLNRHREEERFLNLLGSQVHAMEP